MAFELSLATKAKKDFDKLTGTDREKILLALSSLIIDPYSGKKLEGRKKGYWSYRVWPYRIIYTIRKEFLFIIVVRIADRKEVHR